MPNSKTKINIKKLNSDDLKFVNTNRRKKVSPKDKKALKCLKKDADSLYKHIKNKVDTGLKRNYLKRETLERRQDYKKLSAEIASDDNCVKNAKENILNVSKNTYCSSKYKKNAFKNSNIEENSSKENKCLKITDFFKDKPDFLPVIDDQAVYLENKLKNSEYFMQFQDNIYRSSSNPEINLCSEDKFVQKSLSVNDLKQLSNHHSFKWKDNYNEFLLKNLDVPDSLNKNNIKLIIRNPNIEIEILNVLENKQNVFNNFDTKMFQKNDVPTVNIGQIVHDTGNIIEEHCKPFKINAEIVEVNNLIEKHLYNESLEKTQDFNGKKMHLFDVNNMIELDKDQNVVSNAFKQSDFEKSLTSFSELAPEENIDSSVISEDKYFSVSLPSNKDQLDDFSLISDTYIYEAVGEEKIRNSFSNNKFYLTKKFQDQLLQILTDIFSETNPDAGGYVSSEMLISGVDERFRPCFKEFVPENGMQKLFLEISKTPTINFEAFKKQIFTWIRKMDQNECEFNSSWSDCSDEYDTNVNLHLKRKTTFKNDGFETFDEFTIDFLSSEDSDDNSARELPTDYSARNQNSAYVTPNSNFSNENSSGTSSRADLEQDQQIEQKNFEHQNLKRNLEHLNEQNDILKMKIDDLSESKRITDSSLEKLEMHNGKLLGELDEAQERLKELRDNEEVELNSLKFLREEKEELTKRLQDAVEKYTHIERQSIFDVQKLKSENESKIEELKLEKEEKEMVVEMLDGYKKQVEVLQIRLEDAEGDIELKRMKVEQLRSIINPLELEIDRLRDRNVKYEDLIKHMSPPKRLFSTADETEIAGSAQESDHKEPLLVREKSGDLSSFQKEPRSIWGELNEAESEMPNTLNECLGTRKNILSQNLEIQNRDNEIEHQDETQNRDNEIEHQDEGQNRDNEIEHQDETQNRDETQNMAQNLATRTSNNTSDTEIVGVFPKSKKWISCKFLSPCFFLLTAITCLYIAKYKLIAESALDCNCSFPYIPASFLDFNEDTRPPV